MSEIEQIIEYCNNKLFIIPVIGLELEFYFENILLDDLPDILNLLNNDFLVYCPLSTKIVPECGDFQYEIQILFSHNLTLVIETINITKEILSHRARDFCAKINFAAKPDLKKAGSSLHVHIHLEDIHNNNLFYQSASKKKNNYLDFSIGGLCATMRQNMEHFAPNEDSYLRYKYPDIDTPTTISWGGNNRSVALRMPNVTTNPKNTRIEHRVPCSDSNPENVISLITQGIIYGIEKKIIPPQRIYGIASDPQYNLVKLPTSLIEAKKMKLSTI